MRVIAEDAAGNQLTDFELDHGTDPVDGVADRGLRAIRPLRAGLDDGQAVIILLAQRAGRPRPDPAPVDSSDADPGRLGRRQHGRRQHGRRQHGRRQHGRRQRLATHAWVESSRGVLASQFYRGSTEFRWGPPGGGVDPGESPVEAIHREVMEETGQRIRLGELVRVTSVHRVGPDLAGIETDFHGVDLIYRAYCPEPTDPVVVEVDGTTSAATWFSYSDVLTAPWAPGWREMVQALLEGVDTP